MIRGILILIFLEMFLLQTSFASEQPNAAPTITAPPETITTEVKAAKPALPPSSLFTAPREMIDPQLSPDGKKVVFREVVAGVKFFVVVDLATNKRIQLLEPPRIEMLWHRWAGNKRILIGASANVRQRRGDIQVRRMLVYDLEKGQYKSIEKDVSYGVDGDEILFLDPEGNFIIKSIPAYSKHRLGSQIFKISLVDDKIENIISQSIRLYAFIVDNDGIVRIGINSSGIYYRNSQEEQFKLIGKPRGYDQDDATEDDLLDIPQVVSGSDEGYALSNKETGRFGLYKFNYLTLEVGEKIFDHPENDVTGFVLDQTDKKLDAVRYTDSRDRVVWFNDKMKKHQALLEQALPGQEIWMHEPTRDGKKMIVYTTSPTDPGSYYLYEPDGQKLHRFGGINDQIDPEKMAETRYLKYTARDGREIPAYLTLPKDRAAKNLPLVILPHGGPYGVRDTLDYNAEVQFIVSRGYAVLQPNYRGSDSYGTSYYKAGEGQIGRAMQDDLDDGMDWLVKQGTVDPKRVCIVGSSYGGYAALWGVIRNPERYRCAASFAGVTDFKKQLNYSKRFLSSRHAREWKTTVRGEKDFDLDSVSPALQIKRLKRPVLLTHGDHDGRVPFSQYEIMVAAAKNAGMPIDTKIYEDEGHGFSTRENEQDWYDRLEAFLTKHNPAD